MGSSWSSTVTAQTDLKAKHASFLQVEGSHITRDGKPIVLQGAGLGGWSESGYGQRSISSTMLLGACDTDNSSEHGELYHGVHGARAPVAAGPEEDSRKGKIRVLLRSSELSRTGQSVRY
jgi:hypothetical protein